MLTIYADIGWNVSLMKIIIVLLRIEMYKHDLYTAWITIRRQAS